MTKKEQKKMVKNLLDCVNETIQRRIDNGHIPENWQGLELRQLLADHFDAMVDKSFMQGERKEDYLNDKLINNL